MKNAPTFTILGMVLLTAFTPTSSAGSESICLTTAEDTPIVDNPAEPLLEREVGWGCASVTITYLPQSETCSNKGCFVTIRSELTVTSPACGRLGESLRACAYDREPQVPIPVEVGSLPSAAASIGGPGESSAVTVSSEVVHWMDYGRKYESMQYVCVRHNQDTQSISEWCDQWPERYTLIHPMHGQTVLDGLLDGLGQRLVRVAFTLNDVPVYEGDRILEI